MQEINRLVREHTWAERTNLMGTGLNGLTVGMFGVGNTGGEFLLYEQRPRRRSTATAAD